MICCIIVPTPLHVAASGGSLPDQRTYTSIVRHQSRVFFKVQRILGNLFMGGIFLAFSQGMALEGGSVLHHGAFGRPS